MITDPNTLLEKAKCYICFGVTLAEALELALLADILDASGGGVTGTQFSTGIVNPTAPPAVPTSPAQFFNSVTKFTFNWNIGAQACIGVPKVYRALLTQAGAVAPTAVVLENTIGNIVWSRNGAGSYQATLAGAFLATKTYFNICQSTQDGIANSAFAQAILEAPNIIDVATVVSAAASDDELLSTPFEILVYP